MGPILGLIFITRNGAHFMSMKMVSKNGHIFGVQITGKMVSKMRAKRGLILGVKMEAILPFFSPEMGLVKLNFV